MEGLFHFKNLSLDSMEFQSVLQKRTESIWGYHIMIPDSISEHFVSKTDRRVLCRLNESIDIQAALMPDGNGSFFISINKEVRKKLNLEVGTDIWVHLKKDESKYGIALPEEMEELFKQDEEGSHWFHSLTPGKQRSLLYIVGKPKSSEVRIRKGLVILDYLTTTRGQLNFEELHEALKRR